MQLSKLVALLPVFAALAVAAPVPGPGSNSDSGSGSGSGVVPSDASQVNLAHEKHHEKGPLAVFFALKKEAAEAAGQESTGSEPSSQSPGGEEAKKVLVHVKYTKEGESEFKKIKGIIEGLSEPETIKHGKEGGKDKDEKEGGKDKDDKEGGKDKDDKEGGKDEDGNPSSKTGQDADSKDEKKPEHRFEYEAKAIVESEAAWKKMVTKLEAMTPPVTPHHLEGHHHHQHHDQKDSANGGGNSQQTKAQSSTSTPTSTD